MIKKTALSLFSLTLFALVSCSSDGPEVSEKLRKVGANIEGTWHVTSLNTCEAGKQSATITITDTSIENLNAKTGKKSFVLTKMTKGNSSKYLLLSGKEEKNGKQFSKTLAYTDKGDKLEFAGFFVDNKLLTRAKILENYNADGHALKNLKRFDYVYCGGA